MEVGECLIGLPSMACTATKACQKWGRIIDGLKGKVGGGILETYGNSAIEHWCGGRHRFAERVAIKLGGRVGPTLPTDNPVGFC